MDTTILIIIAVAALVAILVVASLAMMQSRAKHRSDTLRRNFGPEYDRALSGSDSKKDAEAQLQSRQERVAQLQLRDLPAEQCERLTRQWTATQMAFVDEPRAAIAQAQSLVDEAMIGRGYPMGDFEQRAADISVDHPYVVRDYRAARDIADQSEMGNADTESLRKAMLHYRSLFDELLGRQVDAPGPALAEPQRTQTLSPVTAAAQTAAAQQAQTPTRTERTPAQPNGRAPSVAPATTVRTPRAQQPTTSRPVQADSTQRSSTGSRGEGILSRMFRR